jgi:hypothetical protein
VEVVERRAATHGSIAVLVGSSASGSGGAEVDEARPVSIPLPLSSLPFKAGQPQIQGCHARFHHRLGRIRCWWQHEHAQAAHVQRGAPSAPPCSSPAAVEILASGGSGDTHGQGWQSSSTPPLSSQMVVKSMTSTMNPRPP